MTQTKQPPANPGRFNDVVGVDVSKGWIDVFDPREGSARVACASEELSRLARGWARRGALVVFEATGGYDRPLRDALVAAGAAHARVNPARARRFAQASGRARTDAADARMLARMGAALKLDPTPAPPPERAALQGLIARRRQLVKAICAEATRLQQTGERWLRGEIRRLIRVLEAALARLEKRTAALIASAGLAEASRRLQTAPGVGPTVAATLLAEMPELGRLSAKAAGSLAGLAPIARDSGRREPPRAIGGGRPTPRRMLWIAALHATRCNPRFKACRERLEAKGKPPKQAITAAARKLVVILNAMMRDEKDFDAAMN